MIPVVAGRASQRMLILRFAQDSIDAGYIITTVLYKRWGNLKWSFVDVY
jgi:hypothetical protein